MNKILKCFNFWIKDKTKPLTIVKSSWNLLYKKYTFFMESLPKDKKIQKNSEIPVFTTENLEEAESFIAELNSSLEEKYFILGTHSGAFHCDEVLSSIMLKYLPLTNHKICIIRTRNDAILSKTNITYDVGGEYSLANLKFDHHMKTFTGTPSLHLPS